MSALCDIKTTILVAIVSFTLLAPQEVNAGPPSLLNVSYDVTREFYQEFNTAFALLWKTKTGDLVEVRQSHGGSSKQARSVLDGLEADVVTMNNPLDIEVLTGRSHLVAMQWETRLPLRSRPNYSTILFVVRKGNPKGLVDWPDLIKPGVQVIIPNPKTSGNGRYSYLAAYGFAWQTHSNQPTAGLAFVKELFQHVPVLDTGGRGATTTFAQRGMGDVLLTFENEAFLALREFGADKLQIVVPSISVRAENPVAWVDAVVKRRGTETVARAYLEYLFSDAGQEMAARHYFRPQNSTVLAKFSDRFRPVKLFTVEEIFGSWAQVQRLHFDDGGQFDQIWTRDR